MTCRCRFRVWSRLTPSVVTVSERCTTEPAILWTKVDQIKYACAGEIAVCNAVCKEYSTSAFYRPNVCHLSTQLTPEPLVISSQYFHGIILLSKGCGQVRKLAVYVLGWRFNVSDVLVLRANNIKQICWDMQLFSLWLFATKVTKRLTVIGSFISPALVVLVIGLPKCMSCLSMSLVVSVCLSVCVVWPCGWNWCYIDNWAFPPGLVETGGVTVSRWFSRHSIISDLSPPLSPPAQHSRLYSYNAWTAGSACSCKKYQTHGHSCVDRVRGGGFPRGRGLERGAVHRQFFITYSQKGAFWWTPDGFPLSEGVKQGWGGEKQVIFSSFIRQYLENGRTYD